MDVTTLQTNTRGSLWHRWEPHIHTPGTALNNQFGVADWATYCDCLSGCVPIIRALGVTDYLSISNYEKVVQLKVSGHLAQIGFIFPNIELRLGVGTIKGSAINIHLLFSPEDPEHIDQINRFLGRLSFRFDKDEFHCTNNDLMRLGRASNPELMDERSMYCAGVNQFKVNFDQLQECWEKSDWVRQNCLFGVAAGQHDGLSGLREEDGSFTALRRNIESFATFVFSANPRDRQIWLGRGLVSVEILEAERGGLKPCFHGSDAHSIARVGKPDQERFCWIKGDLNFESLRQACIEPEDRVTVGPNPPRGSLATRAIDSITVSNAEWMRPSTIQMNPGLVAIIGARGSGKTALADLLAAGALGGSSRTNAKSFTERASQFLLASRVELTWGNGESTGDYLSPSSSEETGEYAQVQYLSQQFVDDLCSAEGIADTLMREVETVIFNAHPIDEREGATSFEELYDIRCQSALEDRLRSEDELGIVANDLLFERQTKQNLPVLQKEKSQIEQRIQKDKQSRDVLAKCGQPERLKRHAALVEALNLRRTELETCQRQLRALYGLKGDLEDFRRRKAVLFLSNLKIQRQDADLSDSAWEEFLPKVSETVDTWLEQTTQEAYERCNSLAGTPHPRSDVETRESPFIPDEANLGEQNVSVLQAELDRLGELIGIDAQNTEKFNDLSRKLATSSNALTKLNAQIRDAEGADNRITAVNQRRRIAYKDVFNSIAMLETELDTLYAPLKRHLETSDGALGRLGFVIRRSVDVEQWTANGEALLDLRREGPFRGKGALLDVVSKKLLQPWINGRPEEVAVAMPYVST